MEMALSGRFWILPRVYFGVKLDYGEIWTQTISFDSIQVFGRFAPGTKSIVRQTHLTKRQSFIRPIPFAKVRSNSALRTVVDSTFTARKNLEPRRPDFFEFICYFCKKELLFL